MPKLATAKELAEKIAKEVPKVAKNQAGKLQVGAWVERRGRRFVWDILFGCILPPWNRKLPFGLSVFRSFTPNHHQTQTTTTGRLTNHGWQRREAPWWWALQAELQGQMASMTPPAGMEDPGQIAAWKARPNTHPLLIST